MSTAHTSYEFIVNKINSMKDNYPLLRNKPNDYILYIDYYFKKEYLRQFDRENASNPDKSTRISFAHNARTICIAFIAFSSRFRQGNISEQNLSPLFRRGHSSQNISSELYDVFKNLENINYLIKPEVFNNKNQCDCILNRLFGIIIEAGITSFVFESRYDPSLNATNYLKRKEEDSYYSILSSQWSRIKSDINTIFHEFQM